MTVSKVEDQNMFRLMADNMIDLVALHEPDGTYIYISPSVKTILGYEPEELLGTNPYPFFHPDDVSRIEKESHHQAIAGEKIISIEYRIRKKDGEYIWFDTNTMPITDASGRVTKLQTVSREITEKKKNEEAILKLNQELGELNKQKNKLLSVISHDMRGPFLSFQGLFDLILRDFDSCSKKELFGLLKSLKKNTDNTFALLQDLLLWSRNQFEVIEVQTQKTHVKKSSKKVVDYLSSQAEDKHIIIQNRISDDLCIETDEHMFKTILRNLLSNAIKFSPDNAKVIIDTQIDKAFIHFTVKDQGEGISPEIMDKILSIKSTHTTEGTKGEKGFGLGLAICKDFVDKLGGKIYVESQVGKGSTFGFTLPNS